MVEKQAIILWGSYCDVSDTKYEKKPLAGLCLYKTGNAAKIVCTLLPFKMLALVTALRYSS
jgi:hypothetical protein